MLYGVIASTGQESRFFVVIAENDVLAKQYVTVAVGSNFELEMTSLTEIVHSQYKGLAELSTW